MTQLTTRQRRQQRNRDHILDAAFEIVAAHGLAALTMRDLAEAAAYTPATLYKYFESKDAIVAALRERGFAAADAFYAARVPDGLSIPEQLYQAALSYLAFAEQHPLFYQLMYNTQTVYDNYAEMITHPSYQGLRALTAAGLASGDFFLPPGHTVESLTLQHWITAHGLAMARSGILSNPGPRFTAVARQLIKGVIGSFCTYPEQLSFLQDEEDDPSA